MTAALLPKLLALLERTSGGARVYRDEEIVHALPLVLLPGLARVDDPAALSFLADFLVIAGVVQGDGHDAVVAKANAFYAKFPANPQLLAELEDFVQVHLGDGAADRARLARLLGDDAASTPLGGGARPAGTAPGGVLGRLAVASFRGPPDAPRFTFDPSSTAER